MKNMKINFGVSASQLSKNINRVVASFRGLESKDFLPKRTDWSAKMCERIDIDNYAFTGSQSFARTLHDLPDPQPININTLLLPVLICFSSKAHQRLIQDFRLKQSTIKQMISCGFSIDCFEGEGVSFSRWLDSRSIQICRIDFY